MRFRWQDFFHLQKFTEIHHAIGNRRSETYFYSQYVEILNILVKNAK